ncbi:hypothetical protein [Clostridium tyrobutyricum]|uniref:hypothetical protein n=1 Tax=Clostridium tyrobutyricum TaxID=1519 RepID=UPI001C393847|nr:hypothetical protein [Clostridium tyrobutyricum]MBV4439597.1 hypothetical protein [Clostridium tyrobutyricum]
MDVTSKTYKIIIGIVELFLGVPFIGGIFIVAHAWMPLVILFVLHIVGIIIAGREYKNRTGHILGVIGNALGWIPVLGWIFHLAIGIILLVEGLSNR